jgi:hypothetical protein
MKRKQRSLLTTTLGVILLCAFFAPVFAQTILVDFGPNNDVDGRATSNPDSNGNHWNSWRPVLGYTNNGPYVTAGMSTNNLITTANVATEISLVVTANFTGANGILNGGLHAPDGPDSGLLGNFAIETATEDYFFDSYQGGAIKVTGLDPKYFYNFRFFGTREWSSATRETRYSVRGDNGTFTADLVTSGSNIGNNGTYDGNDDTIATVAGVAPTRTGEIYIDISDLQGGYSYIGIMEITRGHAVPTLTEWGMIILAALVLFAGASKLMRTPATVRA